MKIVQQLYEEVIKEKLCSGCGTCIGVCPKQCIHLGENNVVDKIQNKLCISCGLCYKCCPSVKVEFKNQAEIGTNYNKELGQHILFFAGHACDEEVRKNGASGGMATAFLSYLLDYKIVDRVICADFNETNTSYRIVSESEELLRYQKSYYVPVPLNLAIKEIQDSNLKYAVVGTPCQLQGLTAAEGLLPKLHGKIVVKVGLFCGYIQDKKSFKALAQYMGCEGNDWIFKGWREEDYPGYAVFENLKTREKKRIIIYDALALTVPFYTLQKCFICPDGTNQFADISLGDIHAKGKDENIGILRTIQGQRLMLQAQDRGYLTFYELKDDWNHIFKGVITSKRYLTLEQIKERKIRGKTVPEYCNLNTKNDINILKKIFLINKAILYKWSSQNSRITNIKSKELFMKLGKYIYNYPSSSKIYQILLCIKKIVKK